MLSFLWQKCQFEIKETREQIRERYIGDKAKADCPVCRKRAIRMTDFSAGHIVAEACGGVTDSSNLMPICGNCNSWMATTNLYEYCRKEFEREQEEMKERCKNMDYSGFLAHKSTSETSWCVILQFDICGKNIYKNIEKNRRKIFLQ